MRSEIKEIILSQSDQRKAEMACELNRWMWPKELKKFRPETYGNEGDDYKNGIVIIEYIEHIIGHKAFLREWNKDTMTGEEFEKWYRKHQ